MTASSSCTSSPLSHPSSTCSSSVTMRSSRTRHKRLGLRLRFRRQTQRQRRRQGSGIAALQQGACGAEERDSCKSWCFEDAQKGYLGGVRKFMGAAAAAAVLSASSVGGVSAALAAEALPIEQEQLLSRRMDLKTRMTLDVIAAES